MQLCERTRRGDVRRPGPYGTTDHNDAPDTRPTHLLVAQLCIALAVHDADGNDAFQCGRQLAHSWQCRLARAACSKGAHAPSPRLVRHDARRTARRQAPRAATTSVAGSAACVATPWAGYAHHGILYMMTHILFDRITWFSKFHACNSTVAGVTMSRTNSTMESAVWCSLWNASGA